MTKGKRVSVEVSRRYDAASERVFDAWLDPVVARKFLFTTPNGEMMRVDIDARVGGAFTIVERREGKDTKHIGRYVEIERPRRIVFSFAVPDYSPEETQVTVEIVGRDKGCELTLTHDLVFAEYKDQTRDGWAATLEALQSALA